MKRDFLLPLLVTIFSSFLLLSFPRHVFAGTFSLSLGTDHLSSYNDSYTVQVKLNLNVADGTQYFLRGEFYKGGSSNYCGFTWNGSGWNNSISDWTKFLPITISNNTWEGELKAKLDPDDSGCKDSGTYNFKIVRYTSSGSAGSDTVNEQTVSVTLPTPTFSPTPTNTPTSTPTVTPKPSTPTPMPTSKPTATHTPTPTLKPVNYATTKPNVGELTTDSGAPTAVLGAKTVAVNESKDITPTAIPTVGLPTSEVKETPLQKIFLGGMGVLAIVTVGLGLFIYKQSRNQL